MESADDEDAVEREVMRDRNAPRFGEQALAPLKARRTPHVSDTPLCRTTACNFYHLQDSQIHPGGTPNTSRIASCSR